MAVVLLGVVVAAAGPGAALARAGQVPGQAVVADARRLLEAFDFDQVVSRLDIAIAAMVASPDPDLEALATAYDLRGQAHYNLDDQELAARDFELLLQAWPDYELGPGLSPRIVDLFSGVKQRLVGILMVTMPRSGVVTVDDRTYQVEREALIELMQGQHEFAIRQPGYRDEVQQITITPGEFTMITATMERISGTLSVVTVPDGARVLVDDELRGVTTPGSGGDQASAPLLVDDLMPGQHRLRLERDCFVTYETEFSVANPPGDQGTTPLELNPAVAAVSVQTSARDAMIYVDGEPRGLAPAELPALCEGEHLIEVRAPSGRFVDRRVWDAGAAVTLEADLQPAFAIVEVVGLSGPDADELATRIEAALGATRGLLIFAPPRGELEAAAQDLGQRLATPLSGSEVTVLRRRELARGWTDRLNTQGVAWVEAVPAESDAYELFLLAKDSGQPDVVQLALGDVGSRAVAERRLSTSTPPVVRTTINASVVDVAGVVGAAVIRVDAGGVGEVAGLRPGDLIARAADTAVTSAADLARVLAGAEPGEALSLDVRAEDGTERATSVRVTLIPDTIPIADSGLLYNRILLDLQVRTESADSDLIRSASQLSLAVAHMRLESWDLAIRALETVVLPGGSGVSGATVDYLMGLCLGEVGQFDEAREAFRRAVNAGEGTMSVGGPAVASLAQRALDGLP